MAPEASMTTSMLASRIKSRYDGLVLLEEEEISPVTGMISSTLSDRALALDRARPYTMLFCARNWRQILLPRKPVAPRTRILGMLAGRLGGGGA